MTDTDIASRLTDLATELGGILSDCNTELAAKGISDGAETIYEVPNRINGIETGVDTSDANATAGDLASGKTAYVQGAKITGSLASVEGATPSVSVDAATGVVTASVTQAAGIVSAGTKTETHTLSSSDDADFIAENIKKDVVVFGLTGTLDPGSSPSGTKSITANGTGIDVAAYASVDVAVPVGTDTSDATASAGDILSGKTAYVQGAKVTGNIASKTSSDVTVSGRTVLIPAGHYASSVAKSVSEIGAATPSISVNPSTGIVTAQTSQSAGYVSAATKTATYALPTQAGQTITPGTTGQTIQAGKFLTGNQVISGSANLIPGNIKSGVSIFGVTGNYTGSGHSNYGICGPFEVNDYIYDSSSTSLVIRTNNIISADEFSGFALYNSNSGLLSGLVRSLVYLKQAGTNGLLVVSLDDFSYILTNSSEINSVVSLNTSNMRLSITVFDSSEEFFSQPSNYKFVLLQG